jgi:tetratricopeptide (TPR) repeat protein
MQNSSSQSAADRLESALETILLALETAAPPQRAFLLKRAGDVCVSMNERRKALGWYGRAVDQHLHLGDHAQAALLCRMIIHVQPDAVRARCTLAWIAIATEQHADAVRELGSYVEAARQGRQNALAARQLGWMFEAAGSSEVREKVVAALRDLGDATRANALGGALAEGSAPALGAAERRARMLEATIGPPATSARIALS